MMLPTSSPRRLGGVLSPRAMVVALGLMALFAGADARAGVLLYDGTTVGGPTFNRPVTGNPPTDLSAAGTAVAYQATTFTVDLTGAYNFLSTATNPSGWDNFLVLYRTSFNPASGLTNVIISNDDFPMTGLAGFNNVNLTAGTSYILVTTAFFNADAGLFRNSISGQGNITIVPEPTSLALMAGGLALVGLGVRSRATRSTPLA